MANLHNVFLLLIFSVISLAAEESASKFCIRNDLTEVKDEHRQCEILATTFTHKEKNTFYRTMCKDHVRNIKGDYSYFKIRNGILEDRQSYKRLCQEQSDPLLAWVPLATVRDNIAKELNIKERNFYIAKATHQGKLKTELCYFSQSAMLSNDTTKFVCTLMIFEDDFFGLNSDINVLVEILPILYEIRNVTYEPWTNVTHSYKTLLGKSVLKNPDDEEKTIYGSMDYGFMEKIKLDTAAFVNGSLEKLPLAFEHKGNVIDLVNGAGSIEIIKKFYFGRPLAPKSSIKVDLIGQWSEHRREFRADLYENFGSGFSQYKKSLELTKVSFVQISNTEPVYENPESVRVAKRNDESAKLTQGGLGQNITTVTSTTGANANTWNHPYPGFFPYFIVGCVFVGLAVTITIGKMIFIIVNEGKSVKTSGY